MPPPSFYKNRIFKDSWHQAEVGDSPRLKLLPHRMHVSFRRDSRGFVANFLFPPYITHPTRCCLSTVNRCVSLNPIPSYGIVAWEQPVASSSSQEDSEAARSSQEEPKTARTSQEQPEGTSNGEKQPGGARSSQTRFGSKSIDFA